MEDVIFCYVGETYRHFKTRIDEHVKKDKSKTFTNTYTLMKNVSQVLTQVFIQIPTQFQVKIKDDIYVYGLGEA